MSDEADRKEERDLVQAVKNASIDSPNGRRAQAELALLLARRQADVAGHLNKVTEGLRRATVWLAVATVLIAIGTIAQVFILLLKK